MISHWFWGNLGNLRCRSPSYAYAHNARTLWLGAPTSARVLGMQVVDSLAYGATFEGEWVRGCYHGAGVLSRPGEKPERLEYAHGVLVAREVGPSPAAPAQVWAVFDAVLVRGVVNDVHLYVDVY